MVLEQNQRYKEKVTSLSLQSGLGIRAAVAFDKRKKNGFLSLGQGRGRATVPPLRKQENRLNPGLTYLE